MENRPAADYSAIEDARETIAGIQELERISAAFREALRNLGGVVKTTWSRVPVLGSGKWPGTTQRFSHTSLPHLAIA